MKFSMVKDQTNVITLKGKYDEFEALDNTGIGYPYNDTRGR